MMNNPDDLVPRPDPTRLTTEALLREIEQLNVRLSEKIDALEARLDRGEEHHTAAHARETELRLEQHTAISREIEMLDRRMLDALEARDRALAEALATRDKALEVALVTMKERLADQKLLLSANRERSDAQYEVLKETSTLSAGRTAGREYTTGQMLAAGGVVIAFLVLVSLVVFGLINK